MKILVEKMKENHGGVYIIMMYFMLIIVLMTGIYVEYNRITHILRTIDMAYERTLTGVAVNNYDEVYESTREEQIQGGQFYEGNEGGFDKNELPDYVNESDFGEVEEELISLLQLKRGPNETTLTKVTGIKEEYLIKNIEIEMQADGEKVDGKYQMYGKADVTVPIYFLEKKIFEIEVKIKSRAKWRTRW